MSTEERYVGLAFSGGGIRSAAFSLGVLKAVGPIYHEAVTIKATRRASS